MEKSYFEVKITFLHVVIFLVATVLLGILLFYMGYRAGSRSARNQPLAAASQSSTQEQMEIVDEKPVKAPDAAQYSQPIDQEIKLHQQQPSEQEKGTLPQVKPKAQSYYSIQVGAFANFANAKIYCDRFQKMAYPVEIISPEPGDKAKLYRVRVGKYSRLEEALREKEKLEKQENKTFSVVVSR